MIDKDTLRRMCEYPITVSLIGETEALKETARERADRLWGMTSDEELRAPERREGASKC
jgi:hypothetical protein